MADLHNFFLKFDRALALTGRRRNALISSRKAIEKSIIRYFKENSRLPAPKFYIQGSYKTGTIMLKKDNTYDVDLGVYFFEDPRILPKALQQNVFRAVEFQTQYGAQHRQKCVRVIYAGEFNIDLPVYYFPKNRKHPQLATKLGWQKSDPKQLQDWINQKKDSNGQLIRIVKYLKAWADTRAYKMPNGIALSVWAAKYYKSSTRDDVALVNTAKSIKSSFAFGNVYCKCPAQPYDNLVEGLDAGQITRFKEALKQLIDEGSRAIKEKDTRKARNIWAKHLGKRFPEK